MGPYRAYRRIGRRGRRDVPVFPLGAEAGRESVTGKIEKSQPQRTWGGRAATKGLVRGGIMKYSSILVYW